MTKKTERNARIVMTKKTEGTARIVMTKKTERNASIAMTKKTKRFGRIVMTISKKTKRISATVTAARTSKQHRRRRLPELIHKNGFCSWVDCRYETSIFDISFCATGFL